MTVPVKTLADTASLPSAAPDTDPHVNAFANDNFGIQYTNASTLDERIEGFHPNGSFFFGLSLEDPTADNTQASGYRLDNGNIILTWTHRSHTTGDADIQADLFNPVLRA